MCGHLLCLCCVSAMLQVWVHNVAACISRCDLQDCTIGINHAVAIQLSTLL